MISAFAISLGLLTSEIDPINLPIGRKGVSSVMPSQIYDLRCNRPAGIQDIVNAARNKPFVFLGENHATTLHQVFESDLIQALHDAGRSVTVGLEMFTRPKQDVLDLWSKGALSEAEFLEQSDWKHQWGFSFGYYRPVFESVKQYNLPLVALNVPRDWVHSVVTKGYEALPTTARLQLPPQLFLENKSHRMIFDGLMGSHPEGGPSMDGMYRAQVLWDEGMADTVVKYQERQVPASNPVFVVIAGSGHVMYGQGINYRLARRKRAGQLSIVMIQSAKPITISRGLADFVVVTLPAKPAD